MQTSTLPHTPLTLHVQNVPICEMMMAMSTNHFPHTPSAAWPGAINNHFTACPTVASFPGFLPGTSCEQASHW